MQKIGQVMDWTNCCIIMLLIKRQSESTYSVFIPVTVLAHLVHVHWSGVCWYPYLGFVSDSRSTNWDSLTTFLLHFRQPRYHQPSSSWIAIIVPTITLGLPCKVRKLLFRFLNLFIYFIKLCTGIKCNLINIKQLNNVFDLQLVQKFLSSWMLGLSRNTGSRVFTFGIILVSKQPKNNQNKKPFENLQNLYDT